MKGEKKCWESKAVVGEEPYQTKRNCKTSKIKSMALMLEKQANRIEWKIQKQTQAYMKIWYMIKMLY